MPQCSMHNAQCPKRNVTLSIEQLSIEHWALKRADATRGLKPPLYDWNRRAARPLRTPTGRACG